jgi:hypothetical protein
MAQDDLLQEHERALVVHVLPYLHGEGEKHIWMVAVKTMRHRVTEDDCSRALCTLCRISAESCNNQPQHSPLVKLARECAVPRTCTAATQTLGLAACRLQSVHGWSATMYSMLNACCRIAPLNTSPCAGMRGDDTHVSHQSRCTDAELPRWCYSWAHPRI